MKTVLLTKYKIPSLRLGSPRNKCWDKDSREGHFWMIQLKQKQILGWEEEEKKGTIFKPLLLKAGSIFLLL